MEQVITQIVAKLIGRKLSPEHCDKIGKNKKKNKNMLGKKHTVETKQKISQGKIGKKPWNFRGVTPIHNRIRKHHNYKLWRKEVFKRDNYTCQKCKMRSQEGKSVYLNAHHIKPFSKFPSLRLDVSNGITLCSECHYINPSYGL